MAERTALGLVPHTGWTWLVRLRGTSGSAEVEERARVVACEVVAGQVYHLAAERPRDREAFVERRRTAFLRQAAEAVAPHVGGAQALVVVGKAVTLPPLERILAAHPRIHAAEGELWRAVFAEVAAARGLAITRCQGSEAREAVTARLGPRSVAKLLAAGRQAVGQPWTREIQDAALAAWSVLG